MTFRHGVYVREVPTKLYAMREVDESIPFVVGIAPPGAPVNKITLIHNYEDFVTQFGNVPEGASEPDYGLNHFARIFFTLYRMSPAIFVNVFDPSVHKTSVEDEAGTFDENDILQLAHGDIQGALVLTDADGETTYTETTDYTIDADTGIITRVDGGAISSEGSVLSSYDWADKSLVEADDIIGEVDDDTGLRTGLELIERIFPETGLLPGFVVAPGWSHVESVAIKMIACAEIFNDLFRSMAVIDIPETCTTKAEAYAFKVNFSSPHAAICWPRVRSVSTHLDWLSCHFCGLAAETDWRNSDIPYESPSNKTLSAYEPEKIMTLPEVNYLNSQGIVTVHRMITGWKLWGNRTACYPENTDIKDCFIPCRRMANFLANSLILSTWQKVDNPMNKRLIESVVDTTNCWLNGLTGREFLLGGQVYFLESDNPLTDLANGTIRFRLHYLAPPPAEEIEFILEVDVTYFENLFV